MKVDEEGRVWFEKGDKVRPKTVAKHNPATGHTEYMPHDKPIGGIRVADGEIVERKLPCEVRYVDKAGASQQIQLASWLQAAMSSESEGAGGEKSSWRTRWEPSDWYELVVPERAQAAPPQAPKAPPPVGPQTRKEF